MGTIVGLGILVALAGSAAREIARYRRACRQPDELPYPRRRLSRRLGITTIFTVTVGLLTFWPRGQAWPAWLQLVVLLALLWAMGVAFVLLLRDLRETSLEALRYRDQMNAETGRQLESILRRNPPPPPPDPPPSGE